MGETPLPQEPLPPDMILARPIAVVGVAAPDQPLSLATLSRRAALCGVGLVGGLLVAMLVLSFAEGLVYYWFTGRGEPEPTDLPLLIAVDKWLNALAALATLLLFARYHRLNLQAFGIRGDHAPRQAAWGLATLGGVYSALLLSAACTLVLVAVFPQLEEDLTSRLKFLGLFSTGSVLSTVAFLIPVAIHEEVVFRGLLLPLLRRLGGHWGLAVLISTLIFASLHVSQGWLAIPQVFLVGLALSLFFLWSRSLSAVIAAHFLFDFMQLQLAQALRPFLEQATG
jgi:membrane protease YdiL (CAAX protease family)